MNIEPSPQHAFNSKYFLSLIPYMSCSEVRSKFGVKALQEIGSTVSLHDSTSNMAGNDDPGSLRPPRSFRTDHQLYPR